MQPAKTAVSPCSSLLGMFLLQNVPSRRERRLFSQANFDVLYIYLWPLHPLKQTMLLPQNNNTTMFNIHNLYPDLILYKKMQLTYVIKNILASSSTLKSHFTYPDLRFKHQLNESRIIKKTQQKCKTKLFTSSINVRVSQQINYLSCGFRTM